VIEAFVEEHGINRDLAAIGYRDPVTGEEYCVNGDRYFFAASLYKVALNMLWAEKIAAGEADGDTRLVNLPLSYLMDQSLIHSSNVYSATLMDGLGGQRDSWLLAAPYYGLTEEEAAAESAYIQENNITPRQMLRCLDTLWREPERFPGVIDRLLEAEPEHYFRKNEDRWPIAQKYGFMDTKWGIDMNCAAIVYTDSPFLLVVLSHNLYKAEETMSELCSRLGEYTQAQYARRAAATPAPTPSPTPAPSPTPSPVPTAAPTADPVPAAPKAETPAAIYAAAAGCALLLGAAAFIYLSGRRKRR